MKLTLLLLFFLPFTLTAQTISGHVVSTEGEALIGANVYWAGTNQGSSTDESGQFQIEGIASEAQKLVASYVGYASDTLIVQSTDFIKFELASTQQLEEVVVEGKQDGIVISDVAAIKTEQINAVELSRAACCDLAGCFGTQVTVQAQTTNVITNSKELRILGLSGVYNQVLIDGFPIIQGLSYTYGISSIPGTLVENIFVAKGANSVIQGFESISGQINVETKNPKTADRFHLNLYLNNFLENHINAYATYQVGSWDALTAFSTVQPASKVDRDEDNFLDVPLTTRYMLLNKWMYGNEAEWGWSSKIGVRLLSEERIGGQTFFNTETDKGSTRAYGQSVNFQQPEFYTKTNYRPNDNHNFVLFASGFYQDQNSFFGTAQYDAQQTNLYANLQHELNYGKHQLKTGISHRHLSLDENIIFIENTVERTYDGRYLRTENITGTFAENTFSLLDNRLTWMIGIRGDHNNQFGFRATPRTLLKYNIEPRTTIRASVGSGWRTVNLFSENISLLVSSRDIIFEEALQPEEAVNAGINLTHKFEAKNGNISGYFSTDFYHTNFQNQIFPDYDTDPQKAIIKNFRGESVSNGFQVEVFLRLGQQIELKGGYNYLDVYRMVGEKKQVLPFNPRHRLPGTFSYRPLHNKFYLDLNAHWFGEQRLPNTQSNPLEFQRPDFSEAFSLINAQFTYNFKQFELYTGCENIFNFRQNRPIISWEDPFGVYFDTSSVWGPTRGREWYVGLNFKWEKDSFPDIALHMSK
ncbi:MAG: TonB-dependent receptor [Bacteroidota bacterium]